MKNERKVTRTETKRTFLNKRKDRTITRNEWRKVVLNERIKEWKFTKKKRKK